MNRIVLGALAALLFVSAGLFWLQGRAQVEEGIPPPEVADATQALELSKKGGPDELPRADIAGLKGPAPPAATELSREQRRFARYDRNFDSRITRVEMMSSRTDAFRKLDKDGNNLLTFEEWAVATSKRFHTADGNADNSLSPREFATTKPKPKRKTKCRC
ncbi:MAG: EF-hand domain-containing protein [Novosphingobium sp.]|nr:EF-hand domain-containing protein [Novosphingobium sp.]